MKQMIRRWLTTWLDIPTLYCELCGVGIDPKCLWWGHEPSAQIIDNLNYRGFSLEPTYRCPAHKVPYGTRLYAPGFHIGMSFSTYIGKGRGSRPTKTTFYSEAGELLEFKVAIP